jgi:hypothetical protein
MAPNPAKSWFLSLGADNIGTMKTSSNEELFCEKRCPQNSQESGRINDSENCAVLLETRPDFWKRSHKNYILDMLISQKDANIVE